VKGSGKGSDREDRARRRLDKAQTELRRAQEQRAQAVAKGEQEIERARQRAARRLSKATRRVEKRATAVSRAEERLLALSSTSSPGHGRASTDVHGSSASSPGDAADKLKSLAAESKVVERDSVVPGSADAILRATPPADDSSEQT
jgi:hypothetical protein